MKNIFGYFVGILLFLVFFPALMYAVAVNFVVPVDSLIVSTVGAIFVLIGAVFMVWSNIDMVKIGRGCPTDGFNIALGEHVQQTVLISHWGNVQKNLLFRDRINIRVTRCCLVRLFFMLGWRCCLIRILHYLCQLCLFHIWCGM